MTSPLRSKTQRAVVIYIMIGVGAFLVSIGPIPALHITSHGPPNVAIGSTFPTDATATNMNDTIIRPPFAQFRRPPPVIVAVARPVVRMAPPAPSTNGIFLLGIMHYGTSAIALVEGPRDAYPRQIGLGSTIGDWRVTAILTDRILVQSGKSSTDIALPQSPNESK